MLFKKICLLLLLLTKHKYPAVFILRMGTAFRKLALLYSRLEQTSSYNQKRAILSAFFKSLSHSEVKSASYLSLGAIGPWHADIDLGIAGKMAMRAVSQAYGLPLEKVRKLMHKKGDLGDVVEGLNPRKRSALTISQVHASLLELSAATGKDSQKKKLQILSSLLKKSSSLESRYIMRMVLGWLRVGIGAPALMDAFTTAFPRAKATRRQVEALYSTTADIGLVAEMLAKGKPPTSKKKGGIVLGSPIQSMLSQRVKTVADIRKKMGDCRAYAAEEKYDGERIQIHKNGNTVLAFSRRLTNITSQYPAIIEAVRKGVKARRAILDGEVVAFRGGKIRPFQELMQRRRKYRVEEYEKKIPAAVFFFDILYLEGKPLIHLAYPERRKLLQKVLKRSPRLHLAGRLVSPDFEKVRKFFHRCTKAGLEGVIVKSTSDASVYEPGKRSWLWIKWKKEYSEGMRDTFDLVVVGSYRGKGLRKGHFGALLCALYNKRKKCFETFTKVGAGYKDADFPAIERLLKKYKVSKSPANTKITSAMEPDTYYKPGLVIEVLGANITKSPGHSSGLALRFPRFLRVRKDKRPTDATSMKEIEAMKHGK